MAKDSFQDILALWESFRPLFQQGYQILNKTIVLGLPATSMPAESDEKDTGIGSPYGTGAKRVWDFWQGVVHKIMLGPLGKTDSATWHSPYLSSWDYNPFFLDMEALVHDNLVSKQALTQVYHHQKTPAYIDFKQVEKDYTHLLQQAHQKAKSPLTLTAFCNQLVKKQMDACPFSYVGDVPINVPHRVSDRHPDWFLKDFCLGAPPDQYSDKPQVWGFPVLNPTALFRDDPEQPLGPAGRMFKRLLHFYLSGNHGGIRLDHFIGWIDPYCFYTGKKKYKNGRLYSSPRHPILKEFYKRDKLAFRRMTAEFILPLFNTYHFKSSDIFPEDLGIRPKQMDSVLRAFNLGRMLPVQFNQPSEPNHMYHIANANPQDIAVLDTHDNPSVLDFFTTLPEQTRPLFAKQLAEDLRFNYTNDLNNPLWLYRMQWAAALASPAERVIVFFTTLMGQKGRYNIPGNLDSWHLRCSNHFDKEYFLALRKGEAYNPFEAIAWAIYAKGDDFFQQHTDFVNTLNTAKDRFFQALQNL